MVRKALDMQSVKNIMNKRSLVLQTMIGKSVKLFIKGNGNVIKVVKKDGTSVGRADAPEIPLEKTIFNLNANSDLAMRNERNQAILKGAIGSERQGLNEEADKAYSDYLNKVQISVSLLNNGAQGRLAGLITDGTEIKGVLQKITTEQGELLTLDPETISIVEAMSVGKTSFELPDFDAEEGTDEAAAIAKTEAGTVAAQTPAEEVA